MSLVKANRRKYVVRLNGRCGKYCKIPLKHGSGILESLGKAGTKSVLGAIGKNSGSYAGKQLAKFIQDKTGSELLGKIAKSGLSSIGSFAGQRLGNVSGKLLGDTLFDDKKDKKKEQRVSVSELMNKARERLLGGNQSASGINIMSR